MFLAIFMTGTSLQTLNVVVHRLHWGETEDNFFLLSQQKSGDDG